MHFVPVSRIICRTGNTSLVKVKRCPVRASRDRCLQAFWPAGIYIHDHVLHGWQDPIRAFQVDPAVPLSCTIAKDDPVNRKEEAVRLKHEGDEHLRHGEYEKALLSYEKAIVADSRYRDAWKGVYGALMDLDRTDEAKKCMKMIDELEEEEQGALIAARRKKHSPVRKVLTVVIVILFVVLITWVTMAGLGFIGLENPYTDSAASLLENLSGVIASGFARISDLISGPHP